MSEPEWMKFYKMIGQRGEAEDEDAATTAAVAGDVLKREDKDAESTAAVAGDIVTLPCGRRVRRVKKKKKKCEDASSTAAVAGDVVALPSVQRARRIKKNSKDDKKKIICSGLSKFLESHQKKNKHEDRERVFCGIFERDDGTRVRRFKLVKQSQAAAAPLLSPSDESIAAPYRKMLVVGVPDGAVREKMLLDGVPKHIIDPVMTRDNKPYTRHDGVTVRRIKRKVKKQRRSLPTLLPKKGRHASAGLKSKDVAAPYQKLLKMGIMPLGAVKQKMILDGASRDAIDVLETEAKAGATYGKLLRLGMSVEDVRTKMEIAGVEQWIQDAVAPVSAASTPGSVAPAPTNTAERSASNVIPGRSGQCSGRGALLRAIVAGRNLVKTAKRKTAPAVDVFHSDGLDELSIIQKIEEVEERQKKCLALLDRLDPEVTINKYHQRASSSVRRGHHTSFTNGGHGGREGRGSGGCEVSKFTAPGDFTFILVRP